MSGGILVSEKLSRRTFLKSLGATAALLSMAGCTELSLIGSRRRSQKDQPNIIFISTNGQSAMDQPMTGHKFLQMPNLKSLSSQAVIYTRHYSNAPLSTPAKNTWITGACPHDHGKWSNDANKTKSLPTMMQSLTDAGYYNIAIGNMDFCSPEMLAAFNKKIIANGQGLTRDDNTLSDDYAKFLANYGLKRWDYLKLQSPGENSIQGVYDWPYEDYQHIDAFVGDQAANIIRDKKTKKPFFLWVSFNGPQSPWDPPARCSQKYKNMSLPKPNYFEGELNTKPLDHTTLRYSRQRDIADRIDKYPQHRQKIINRIKAAHFGSLTFIDEQIEKISKALQDRDQLLSTAIIYSSSQGSNLGDHNLIYDGNFYETAARVPLIVRYPEKIKPQTTHVISSHIDIMPTILSIAAANIPNTVQGKNITPVHFGEKVPVRDVAILNLPTANAIVTSRWKLSIYPQTSEGELYDLKYDNAELNNLFGKPEYIEVQKKLTQKLIILYPTLAQEIAKVHEAQIPQKNNFQYNEPQIVTASLAPFCMGKTITITARINQTEDDDPFDGPLVVQGNHTHGFALFINNGSPVFAAKRWGKWYLANFDRVFVIKKTIIKAVWNKDGQLILNADGRMIASQNARGPWPIQPGKRAPILSAQLNIAKLQDSIKIQEFTINKSFTGNIKQLNIDLI